MSKTVPINPIITPIIWLLDENILNAIKPRIIVLIGTIEFRIDATALSISVSAKANKKAGKNVPKNPEIAIHFNVVLESSFNPLNPATNRINPEKIIRIDPN